MTRKALPICLAAGVAATLAARPPGLDGSSLQSANEAFVLIPERPSSVFADATATHVPPAPSLHATDSVFLDADKDGDLDVVLSVEYGANRLYLNDGTGRLTHVPGAFGTAIHDSEHVRAADFDRDGSMDVVFVLL